MEEKNEFTQKNRRGAGILYIIMVVFLIFSGIVVKTKLYVPDDAVATASNILASEWLFRLGFVSDLVGLTLQLFLVHVLYELFKSVEKGQARMMVILIVAGVSVAFMNKLIIGGGLMAGNDMATRKGVKR